MKRSNIKSEMAILRTLCNTKKKTIQGEIWMRLRPEYFGTDASRELYDRIKEITEDSDAIPSFRILKRDHSLSDAALALLKGDDIVLSRSEVDASMLQLKDSYRARVCADLNESLAKSISGTKAPSLGKIETMLEEALFSLRNPEGASTDLLHGATGDSRISDILVDILKGKSTANRIKTGWGEFDTKTGGFSRGDLVVLTANYGGGKSAAALTMFRNMHNFGYTTAMASMELDHPEIVERMVSSISGVEYSKIRNNQLSKKEKRKVVEAFDEFDNPKTKKRYTIMCPTNEVTIKDIFRSLSPYQYDVIFIDYIGLLKQVATTKNAREDQILGEAARYCKIMANKLKCVVVLLAQMNDQGKVMYSNAIAHHANFWFKWRCEEEDKLKGFVTIEQGKARGAPCYDFYLTTDFSRMTMDNYTGAVEKTESKTKVSSEESGGYAKRKNTDIKQEKTKIKMSLVDD